MKVRNAKGNALVMVSGSESGHDSMISRSIRDESWKMGHVAAEISRGTRRQTGVKMGPEQPGRKVINLKPEWGRRDKEPRNESYGK